LLCAAKNNIEFTFKQSEGLLEIVTVRRWPSAWRNEHVDQTKTASRFLAGQKKYVRISDDPNVTDFRIFVRLNHCKRA